MRGLKTDHVISGPTRGLKNKRMGNGHQTEKQTNRHVDSMTDPAQRAESLKTNKVHHQVGNHKRKQIWACHQ